MKKNYEKPTVEVVKFQYRDQVVVASSCRYQAGHTHIVDTATTVCTEQNTWTPTNVMP